MPHVFEIADRIHIQRLGRRSTVITPGSHSMSEAVAIMTGAARRPSRTSAPGGAGGRVGNVASVTYGDRDARWERQRLSFGDFAATYAPRGPCGPPHGPVAHRDEGRRAARRPGPGLASRTSVPAPAS
jgi:hypothetical protein